MRWSRLQKLIYNLIVDKLPFQIHCSSYRREIGGNLGRYWVTLDKKTVWQAPGDYHLLLKTGVSDDTSPIITSLLREYLDTARSELACKKFELDSYGICDVLRAADRRIGKAHLKHFLERDEADPARKILEARLTL
jgi:hypothetical protein